jgi:hypothetical protein
MQKGQSIIEFLIAMGLAVIFLPALITGLVASREGKPQQGQRAQALTVMQETYDAMRSIREKGWLNIDKNGTFHPEISGSAWQLVSGQDTVNGFIRKVQISDVYRDNTGKITTIGDGKYDPSTKMIEASISWSLPYPSAINSTWYMTRFLDNTAFTHTLVSDFNKGGLYDTQVVNNSGGEVTLANNNKAKWCSPATSSATIDLPDGPPVAVAATASAINTSSPNQVFVATSPNSSTFIKLAYLTVTANTVDPIPTLQGTFTLESSKYSNSSLVPDPVSIGLDNNFITRDVRYYTSSGGKLYALLAIDKPDKEVIAIQIKDGASDTFQDPVNKIYKYWSFFNTNIYNGATTTSYDSGYVNPSANAAETGGDNNGYESNPNRAYTSDNNYAVDNNSGSNTGTSCLGADKDKHRYSDYNLNIPSGYTINGIEVRLEAKVDSTTGSPKICTQLSWDGGNSWTTAKTTNQLTSNDATYTLGGSSDTWGHTWTTSELNNANFKVRLIDIASNISRDFSLDQIAVRIYGTGPSNDQSPFEYGASSLAILGNRGYISSGGYLYVFDLSNIDTKSPSSGLDQIGCRIELDGYDCKPTSANVMKYGAGQSGVSWSDSASTYNNCVNGGNEEIFADNDLYGVQSGGNNYIFVAAGSQTDPELDIVNTTSVPGSSSSPSISNSSCGRISGGNSGWKVVGSLDFNTISGTEEAANSVFATSDGTRAYISSNGGIDANHDGQPDSKQLYIINTSNKSSPAFLSGTPGTGPTSGYYYGTGANAQLYPRRSLTVLNGERAILVGKDGISDSNNAQEYQVVNISTEATPVYCGGINFDQGFNDLTSVSEADGDNFVYMVANTMEKQLKIVEGGPDTGIFVSSGGFESKIFDATNSAVFNNFKATVDQPSETTIKMQVASAATPSSGLCADAVYNFLGPNGIGGTSPSAYFYPNSSTISGTIPLGVYGTYQNPNRCFRYKAYLDNTNSNKTPTLFDVSVNYSP